MLTSLEWKTVPDIPKPEVGKSYIDPVHGQRVTRVTDCIRDGHPAIVPPYSNRPFGLTKRYGCIFLLYRKGPGSGHRLMSATHPFPSLGDVNWGKLLSPREPENEWFGCTPETSSRLFWLAGTQFWTYDFDSDEAPEMIYELPANTGEVFMDTHGLPSLDGTRVAVSWFVSDLEKRLAVVDLLERRVLWEAPYMALPTKGYQRRTGTPIMAVDGEFFAVPIPRDLGNIFYVYRVSTGKAERILCADFTYEHSGQAQVRHSSGRMLDLYVSKTSSAYKNPTTLPDVIDAPQTPEAFLLVSNFEDSWPETPWLSTFEAVCTRPAGWGGAAGVHITGGAWKKPSRVAFSCFAPSNATFRYDGRSLPPGHGEIVVVDLDRALVSKGTQSFMRACHGRSATQASNDFGNSGYWSEYHPMISPLGDLVAFGSDFNFAKPESQWTLGIDTYVVEVS